LWSKIHIFGITRATGTKIGPDEENTAIYDRAKFQVTRSSQSALKKSLKVVLISQTEEASEIVCNCLLLISADCTD
jgi:hypothetical protein